MIAKVKDFLYWHFYSFIFHVCRLFPIQDKVLFGNFSGKRYGDNPKYISEGLHRHDPNCKILWQCHYQQTLDVPEYVSLVRWPSVRYMYELATSKVWVDSHLKKLWMKPRKKQRFMETWHGGLGFKKIEGDAETQGWKDEVKEAYHTGEIADVFVSNSRWLSDIYRRAFRYQGEIIETGYPKNDIFFRENDDVKQRVRSYYGVDSETKIILYAPTFRNVIDRKAYDVDFSGVLRCCEERFGARCLLIVRLHPLMMKEAEHFYEYSEQIVNGTDYPDTQELVLATDIMITDYSSIIFDFMLMGKPGFLFAADLEEYRRERGFYYEMEEYPFPCAQDNASLQREILAFDDETYQEKIKAFENKTGLKERGTATEELVALIQAWRKK